ncbi:MAG: hypothetical protein IJ679_05210, partial [Lachnospiraceae bacterium]|nr:hypothetical protein [Lachnospiraceae bacterium]
MANGFGSLYVGNSGLAGAQNGLNVVANNIANADTVGYVRQQVVYEDKNYLYMGKTAAISKIQGGLGVGIGDVAHTRDMFLDRAYRSESGRQNFYEASYEAAWEVETMLNESNGALGIAFSQSIQDLDDAFNEFANTPGDAVSQNLVAQKAALFLTRAEGVYTALANYQSNINTKIQKDIDRINELGDTINELNWKIQKVEAGGVETAMEMRDARDSALDELASLVNISYKETVDGVVKVQVEGTDFVIGSRYYKIESYVDPDSGFVTPYWGVLSEPRRNDYYEVFDLTNIDPQRGSDVGELKALLLARGDAPATYLNMLNTEYYKGNIDDKYTSADQLSEVSAEKYDSTVANSMMVNSEAELDRIVHELVTRVNELLSPTVELSSSRDVSEVADKLKEDQAAEPKYQSLGLSAVIVHDQDDWTHTMSAEDLRIFDR